MEKRLQSLDVFRGLTIILMILVNTPGSWAHIYPPLEHSKWHGCTPTDLVFPFFLFIVGVSMSFSFKKFDYSISKKSVSKILIRGFVLFAISWTLRAFPFNNVDFSTFRFLGVLPRISLAYMLASFIVLTFRKKSISLLFLIILFFYWGIMWFFAETQSPYSLEDNFARVFDLKILGEAHLYHGFGIAFDPEGLLSTLPSVGTVLLGYLTGFYIKMIKTDTSKLFKLIIFGIALVFIGIVWDRVFPINKPLWTSSYVLYSGGIAILILSLLYYIIEVKQAINWIKPFIIYGRNPLFGFVLSILFVKILWKIVKLPDGQTGYSFIYNTVYLPYLGELNGSLAFAISYVIFIGLILWYMDWNRVYIKI